MRSSSGTAVPWNATHFIQLSQALNGNTCLRQISLTILPANDDISIDIQDHTFRNTQLREINLKGMGRAILNSLIQAIRKSSTLRRLRISCCLDVDLDVLSTLFASNHDYIDSACSLVELSFDCCRFDTYGNMAHFFQLFHSAKSVEKFSLRSTPISDAAIADFVQYWPRESSIRDLAFSSNSITPQGAQLVMQAAASHPTLESLSFAENLSIGYDGIRLIGQKMRDVHLVELDLTACVVHNASSLGRYRAACALAKGLENNHTLQKLRWAGNNFKRSELRKVIKATSKRSPLLHLEIRTWRINEMELVGKELGAARIGQLQFLWMQLQAMSAAEESTAFDPAYHTLLRGISASKTLQSVVFGTTGMLGPDETAKRMLMAVQNHPTIERLKLTTFGAVGLERQLTIGEQVGANTTLKLLSLKARLGGITDGALFIRDILTHQADIIDCACAGLAEGLRRNTSLQTFRLRNPCVSFPNALRLVRAITNHPSLKKVSLSLDRSISYDEVAALAGALRFSHLREFKTDFCIRALPAESDADEAIAAKQRAHNALLDVVKHNLQIQQLRLTELAVDEEITFYLDLNRYGRNFMHGQANLAPALWCDVLGKLEAKSLKSCMFYFISEHPWLVPSGVDGM